MIQIVKQMAPATKKATEGQRHPGGRARTIELSIPIRRMVIKMVMMVFIGRFLLSVSYRQNTENYEGGG